MMSEQKAELAYRYGKLSAQRERAARTGSLEEHVMVSRELETVMDEMDELRLWHNGNVKTEYIEFYNLGLAEEVL
jgi:hypothetical protein